MKTQKQKAGRAKTRVDVAGKRARTIFKLVHNYQAGETACAYLEALIETGRTHQIRVHAAHLGHPLGGDPRYGDVGFNQRLRQLGLSRIYLHASELAFTHPLTASELKIVAQEPRELSEVLATLERSEF